MLIWFSFNKNIDLLRRLPRRLGGLGRDYFSVIYQLYYIKEIATCKYDVAYGLHVWKIGEYS